MATRTSARGPAAAAGDGGETCGAAGPLGSASPAAAPPAADPPAAARSASSDPEPRRVLEVVTADGVRLAVEHIPAEGRARGVVVCGHAVMANRRSLDRPRGAGLGAALASSGLETYLVDHRGHGETARISPQVAETWSYHDLIRYDWPALAAFARGRHPGLGVAGLGHSLSGHAALAWLGDVAGRHGADAPAPLDAFVSVAANVWLRHLEPHLAVWLRKRAVMEGLRVLARAFGRVPARRFRQGSDDWPRRAFDDLWRCVASDTWRGPDGADYLAGTARVRVPVLAVVGAGDTLFCREEAWRRFHARLPDVRLRVYAADVCGGLDPGHMGLVTDARSSPAWHDMAKWLVEMLDGAATSRVASPAPGK